ncbi:Flp family type IVb pilin [Halalkalibacter krulwichiae]|uniref:Flp/Fap pilin component n=1 Tax=Halalkalibacter krulwichiae TaxID=199441 RepID=A0A1X9MH82_9BACI|nr:Flp family type IVb pilin [Halalkalibacter krulwichiae]ARK31994.1 Flp/Fap pilin component [Halalkalibacter krulwichiae]
MNLLKKFWNDESGQALSEYGVILGIILIGVIVAITALRDRIMEVFNKIAESLSI